MVTQQLSFRNTTGLKFIGKAIVSVPRGTDVTRVGNDVGTRQQHTLIGRTQAFDIYRWAVEVPAGRSYVLLSETYTPASGGPGHVWGANPPPPLGGGGSSSSGPPNLTGFNDPLPIMAAAWGATAVGRALVLKIDGPDGPLDVNLSGGDSRIIDEGPCRIITQNHVLTAKYGGFHWWWDFSDLNGGMPRLTINWHTGVPGLEVAVRSIRVALNTTYLGGPIWVWPEIPDDTCMQLGSGYLVKPLPTTTPEKFHIFPRTMQRLFRLAFTRPNAPHPGEDPGWGVAKWVDGGFQACELPIPDAMIESTQFSGLAANVISDTQTVRANLASLTNSDAYASHDGPKPPNALFPVLGVPYGGPTGSDGKYLTYPGIKTLIANERAGLTAHKIRQLRHHSRDFTAVYEPNGDVVVPENHLVGGVAAWDCALGGGSFFQQFGGTYPQVQHYGPWKDNGFGFSNYATRRFFGPPNQRGYEVAAQDNEMGAIGATISVPGTGFTGASVGQFLTPNPTEPAPGSPGIGAAQVRIRITSVGAGGVTGIALDPGNEGSYSTFPRDSTDQSVVEMVGGDGTGCKLRISWFTGDAWQPWDDQHRLLLHADDIALAWLTGDPASIMYLTSGAEACRLHLWARTQGRGQSVVPTENVVEGKPYTAGRGQFWGYFVMASAAVFQIDDSPVVDDDGNVLTPSSRLARWRDQELRNFIQNTDKACGVGGIGWCGGFSGKVFTTAPFLGQFANHQNFEVFYGVNAIMACFGVFGDAWTSAKAIGGIVNVRRLGLKLARTAETLMWAEYTSFVSATVEVAGSGYAVNDVIYLVSDRMRCGDSSGIADVRPLVDCRLRVLTLSGSGLLTFAIEDAGQYQMEMTDGYLGTQITGGLNAIGARLESRVTGATVAVAGTGYRSGDLYIINGESNGADDSADVVSGKVSAKFSFKPIVNGAGGITGFNVQSIGRYYKPPPASIVLPTPVGGTPATINLVRTSGGKDARLSSIVWATPQQGAVGTLAGATCHKVFAIGAASGGAVGAVFANKAALSPRDINLQSVFPDPWPSAGGNQDYGAQTTQVSSIQAPLGLWAFAAAVVGEEDSGYWASVAMRVAQTTNLAAFNLYWKSKSYSGPDNALGGVLIESSWPIIAFVYDPVRGLG